MSATSLIQHRIDGIEPGQLFSTRQFLSYGSRGAVDQTLYLLVKAQEIVRVARGVFMKKGSQAPTAEEVAKVKAKAFGKRIFIHGVDAAHKLGFSSHANQDPMFACSGRSSCFRFGKVTIRLIGTSPRKLHYQDSLVGQIVRAMWQLGKELCTDSLLSETYPTWSSAIGDLERAAPMLPAWMSNLFYWGRINSRRIRNGGNLPPLSMDLGELLPEFAEIFRSIDDAL